MSHSLVEIVSVDNMSVENMSVEKMSRCLNEPYLGMKCSDQFSWSTLVGGGEKQYFDSGQCDQI